MRDPNRIPRMLKLIEQIWSQSPDIRLFQMLVGAIPNTHEHNYYWLEDDVLEQRLKEMWERYKPCEPTESQSRSQE